MSSIFDNVSDKKKLISQRLEFLREVERNLNWYRYFKKFGASKEFLEELFGWAKFWGGKSEELKITIKKL